MRIHLTLAAALVLAAPAAAWAGPFDQDTAVAGPFDQEAAVAAGDLDGKRGGTETAPISGSLFQGNDSALSGSNTGNVSVGGGAMKYSGTIAPAQVMNNHGITAVMQNTGDLVNMNNATSVNVYMR